MSVDIESFRKEYKTQKKIEKIVISRELSRPKTTKAKIIILYTLFAIMLLSSVIGIIILKLKVLYKILILVGFLLMLFEVYFRYCLIETVKCYQHYADSEIRRTCKCIPSCSEYAVLSFKNVFPLVVALYKIRRRLYVVCDGKDYKIDFPTKKTRDLFGEI